MLFEKISEMIEIMIDFVWMKRADGVVEKGLHDFLLEIFGDLVEIVVITIKCATRNVGSCGEICDVDVFDGSAFGD